MQRFRLLGYYVVGVVAAVCFHDPMNGLALEPGFAGGNFAQAIDQDFRFHFARENAMRSAAEQFKRELFIRSGRDYNNLQLRRLAQKFCYSFDRIRGQRSLEDQNVGGKLGYGRLRLRQSLSLADHADIVFESKNLAQSGAENSLGIGQDHANELAGAAILGNAVIFSHPD